MDISLLLWLRLVLFGYGYGYDLSSSVTAITAISVMLFLFCSVFTLITLFRLVISSFFSAFPQNPSFPSRVFALLFVFVFSLESQKRNIVTRRTAEIAEEKKTLAEKKIRKWMDNQRYRYCIIRSYICNGSCIYI